MRTPLLAAILFAAIPAIAQTPEVKADHAWARATAPGATVGGVFLTLQGANAPDRLVSASTPEADMAQVHETTMDGGVMRMREVPGLDLPAGTPVTLKPGGMHVMLMGLKQQLKPGDRFPLTLTFEKAAPVTTTVVVGTAGAAGPTD